MCNTQVLMAGTVLPWESAKSPQGRDDKLSSAHVMSFNLNKHELLLQFSMTAISLLLDNVLAIIVFQFSKWGMSYAVFIKRGRISKSLRAPGLTTLRSIKTKSSASLKFFPLHFYMQTQKGCLNASCDFDSSDRRAVLTVC